MRPHAHLPTHATRRRTLPALLVSAALAIAATPAAAAPSDAPTASGEITYPVVDLNATVEPLTLPVEKLEFGTATVSGGVKKQGETITLAGEILFEPNKHTLSAEASTELEHLVATLKKYEPAELTVVGHTDDVQSAAHNQELSERRAETIAEVLRDELGGGLTIEASGKGEAEPIADNETEKGRALNRRVVVTVVK